MEPEATRPGNREEEASILNWSPAAISELRTLARGLPQEIQETFLRYFLQVEGNRVLAPYQESHRDIFDRAYEIEVREVGAQYSRRLPMKPGEGYAALERARRLLGVDPSE